MQYKIVEVLNTLQHNSTITFSVLLKVFYKSKKSEKSFYRRFSVKDGKFQAVTLSLWHK